MHFAAYTGNTEIIGLLQDKGAYIDVQDKVRIPNCQCMQYHSAQVSYYFVEFNLKCKQNSSYEYDYSSHSKAKSNSHSSNETNCI